ncbi:hypothetical protein F3J44_24395 [Pantoea sp. Tr-811]|nr:hypothetical protein [Pantoea sp. Tr-811]
MNTLILLVAIFVSIFITSLVLNHFNVDPAWKIGSFCLVSIAVQIAVSRIQRSRRRHSRFQ